jgi:hypothetical protein
MRNTHERVVAIVPMIGTGTEDDPRRPMFAPLAAEMAAPADDKEALGVKPTVGVKPAGRIIAYTCKPSDDGRFALVEFVATDRAALSVTKTLAGVTCSLDSMSVDVHDGVVLRAAIRGQDPRAYVDNELAFAIADSSISTGMPAFGGF